MISARAAAAIWTALVTVLLVSAIPRVAGGQFIVRGTVFDSVRSRPLSGAIIGVEGRPERTRTLPDGSFALEISAFGQTRVILTHPVFDSLGLFVLKPVVELDTGRVIRISTPSVHTMLQRLCGRRLTDSSAVHGVVRSPLGEPVDAEVRVSWMQYGIDSARRVASRRMTLTTTAPGGVYSACGVPTDQPLEIEAVASDGQRTRRLRLPTTDLVVQYHDLVISDRGQTATLRGQITATQRRLAGAIVEFGEELEIRTDDSGTFILSDVPTGSVLVRVAAVGFSPQERLVHLLAGQVLSIEVALEQVVLLDAVRVAAERDTYVSAFVQAAEERRRSGLARFRDSVSIGREQILAGAFGGIGGLSSRSAPGGGVVLTMRAPPSIAGGGGDCEPRVIVNRVGGVQDLTNLQPQDIAWIEVYPRATALPAEFQVTTLGRHCGVVFIATKEHIRR